MRLKQKITILLSVALLLHSAFALNVSAYQLIGYRLLGGISSRTYYVTSTSYTLDGVTLDYAPLVNLAVSNWNSAVSSLSFSRVSTASTATIYYTISNRGATGYAGLTCLLDASGYYITNDGSYPTRNWSYAQLVLNPYYLQDSTYNQIVNVAAHEFGHALGLAHADSLTLMYESIYNVSTLRRPTYDDIVGVNAIYG